MTTLINTKSALSYKKSASFTLVEILVVVSIIGLLAGLGFPAINGALQTARKAEVAGMAESIKTGILAYYAEYLSYPSWGSSNTDSNFFSVMTSNNPRGISFLEVPPKFTNSSGIVTPENFGYANRGRSNFLVAMDTQGIGVLTNRVGAATFTVPASVAVWVADPKNPNKPVGTFK
jgi:prepilin-type N-terminal cleavage/methylation domain-containing protein